MKKIISLVCSSIMLCSFAFAADVSNEQGQKDFVFGIKDKINDKIVEIYDLPVCDMDNAIIDDLNVTFFKEYDEFYLFRMHFKDCVIDSTKTRYLTRGYFNEVLGNDKETFVYIKASGELKTIEEYFRDLDVDEDIKSEILKDLPSAHLLGDTNYDDKIDISDVVKIRSVIVSGEKEVDEETKSYNIPYDFNADRTIDILDVVLMRAQIVNG